MSAPTKKKPGKEAVSHVDWENVRSRLAGTVQTLEEEISPGPELKKKILRERAMLLARAKQAEEPGEQLEIVEFVLTYESYAVEARWVREVYPLREVTALPGTPPFILGIINVRGQIISVLDLKILFDLPERGLTNFDKVIIVTNGRMEFGLLVDSVSDVRFISRREIHPPPATLSGLLSQHLLGVTPERLIVLEAESLLKDSSLVVNQ